MTENVLLLVAQAIGRSGTSGQDDPLDNVLDNLSPEDAALVALNTIPDGWAKWDGRWWQLEPGTYRCDCDAATGLYHHHLIEAGGPNNAGDGDASS